MRQEIQGGLADIMLPALPDPYAWPPGMQPYVIALVLLVVAVAALRWFTAPRGRAHMQLAVLRHRLARRSTDPRRAAYDISRILSNAIGVNGLGTRTELPARLYDRQTSWTAFISLLEQARYCRGAIRADELDQLFRFARYWLRHWP